MPWLAHCVRLYCLEIKCMYQMINDVAKGVKPRAVPSQTVPGDLAWGVQEPAKDPDHPGQALVRIELRKESFRE